MTDWDAFADAVALRVVDLLRADSAVRAGLVGVRELAAELGVSERFVRDHADQLGVIRLGAGPKPRLRFDVEQAKREMFCSVSRRSSDGKPDETGEVPQRRRRNGGRLPNGLPKPGAILAVRRHDDEEQAA